MNYLSVFKSAAIQPRRGSQIKMIHSKVPKSIVIANQFCDREGWRDGVFTEHQEGFQDNEAPVSLLVSRTTVAIGDLQSLLLSW